MNHKLFASRFKFNFLNYKTIRAVSHKIRGNELLTFHRPNFAIETWIGNWRLPQ